MEEFAQSRGDDDLFSDEIVPLPSQPHLPDQTEQSSSSQSIQTQPQEPPTGPSQQQTEHVRGRGRGRGRARARTEGQTRGSGGLHDSKFAPRSTAKPARSPINKQTAETNQVETESSSTTQPGSTEPTQVTTEAALDSEHESKAGVTDTQEKPIPTGPAQTITKPPAVRGDRTATGGIAKPKLTKEELDAKLAAAKERSKNLSEKHAKAQADAADFEERERVAKQKRQEELIEGRKLQGERERNRARKLQAVGGREWDAEKNEDDFKQPRYGQSVRRGPAEDQQDLSIYEWRDPAEIQESQTSGRGRGRGQGRGRGRGRGSGRVYDAEGGLGRGLSGPASKFASAASKPPTKDDFPALPGTNTTTNKDSARPPAPPRKDSDRAPTGSWADQMAS